MKKIFKTKLFIINIDEGEIYDNKRQGF